ncbi:MAG: glycoside hydrolase family 1 protein [bacterium]|nr:glycoside hydrolase family 1 protein [bacterium]
MSFPPNFLWGSATSAYQTEGDNKNCDWWQWEKEKGLEQSGKACDHYHLFREDFALAKSLNQNSHRLSLEWSRIEPEEGEWNEAEIEHYIQVLKTLKAEGMQVMLSLHHFTLPVWFSKKGGFSKRKNIFYFQRFAELAAKKFSDYVDFWITINEPNVYASHGYLLGNWPPGEKSFWQYQKVIHNLALSHKAAYRKIHKLLPEAKVGIAKNYIDFEAGKSWADKISCRLAHYFWNRAFYQKTKSHHDFLGINYYFHNRIYASLRPPFYTVKNENKKISDIGAEIYPEGLCHILLELKKYKLPIYITENGLADREDKLRGEFITQHIAAIERAIAQDVDVRGYFYWSLLDNFEWAHGFAPCFGLVEVDYATQKRIIRPSARIYADKITQYTS